jgi:hypothetical protein
VARGDPACRQYPAGGKRVEFFSTATWRISPALLSNGARYETSTLTQSGDSSLTKDLAYFKRTG